MDPKKNMDDKDLHDLFAERRAADADQAPAFEPLWNEAVARVDRRWGAWWRYAAAAVLLVGLGVIAVLRFQPQEPVVAMSITEWQSPTARLLDVPGSLPVELPTATLLDLAPADLDAVAIPDTTN